MLLERELVRAAVYRILKAETEVRGSHITACYTAVSN
jgi:hypothetical protein